MRPISFKLTFLLLLLLIGFFMSESCTHDPSITIVPDPNDTITNPVDTTVHGTPCDPNVVYFEKDILPILIGNCAYSGCHDVQSHKEGVVLNNYQNVLKEVKANDASKSELYKVMIKNNNDVMPPSGKLPADQIALIATWINQGAKNETCDENAGPCVTTNISYSTFVAPFMATYCNGCHSTAVAFGGVVTDKYTDLSKIVTSGKLLSTINWEQGALPMPQGQSKLSDCNISKIKSWVDDGAKNN